MAASCGRACWRPARFRRTTARPARSARSEAISGCGHDVHIVTYHLGEELRSVARSYTASRPDARVRRGRSVRRAAARSRLAAGFQDAASDPALQARRYCTLMVTKRAWPRGFAGW